MASFGDWSLSELRSEKKTRMETVVRNERRRRTMSIVYLATSV